MIIIFGEIGIDADNEGTILACRMRGFALLEARSDFLDNSVLMEAMGKNGFFAKVLRRFIWHDRIHAKAMYRMAVKTFGVDVIPNIFKFKI